MEGQNKNRKAALVQDKSRWRKGWKIAKLSGASVSKTFISLLPPAHPKYKRVNERELLLNSQACLKALEGSSPQRTRGLKMMKKCRLIFPRVHSTIIDHVKCLTQAWTFKLSIESCSETYLD